jgi:pimeloyl-ACP methyl ester carboxylesterase
MGIAGTSESTRLVAIPAGTVELEGLLCVPDGADALVLFAHGSGSSRHSSRNNYVARALRAARMGTLLFDLLTEEEAAARANVFDVDFLAERLAAARHWVRRDAATRHLRVGYFGASTGAAAALIAAAADATIGCIVSRGGRPDLAASALPKVKTPTLLIVGGDDTPVIRMNEEAYELLRCEKRMTIVPGASHLFEEPGTLEEVVRLATDWFRRHLAGEPGKAAS